MNGIELGWKSRGDKAVVLSWGTMLVAYAGTAVPMLIWDKIHPDHLIIVPWWVWTIYSVMPWIAIFIGWDPVGRPSNFFPITAMLSVMLIITPGLWVSTSLLYLPVIILNIGALILLRFVPRDAEQKELAERRATDNYMAGIVDAENWGKSKRRSKRSTKTKGP